MLSDYSDDDEFGGSDYNDDDINDDDGALPNDSALHKGKKPEYHIKYESLSPQRMQARVDQELEDVVAILGVQHFRWNKDRLIERYMDSPAAALLAAGEPSALLLSSAAAKEEEEQERERERTPESPNDALPPCKRARTLTPCGVCCEDVEEGTLRALRCRHRFCAPCWAAHVANAVRGEGRCVVACMEEGCAAKADAPFIRGVVDSECYARYQTLVLQSFVACTPDFRFCPHPACAETVHCAGARGASLLLTYVPTVQCAAGHAFCFGCGLESSHRPAICAVAKRWIDAKEDSGTSQWIKANTRTCPKCRHSIEKSGGCNRMVCRHCMFQFCWMCMKNWDAHGYNDSVCNAFVEPEKDAQMSEAAVKLERWLFYFDRFNNHELSARLDQELCERTESKMVEIQQSSSLSWIETKFMQNAVDELTKCRLTLKWSYAMAHFLAKGNKKQMFEDIQADLEGAVEQLSQMLDEPIEEESIKDLRRRVTDKTVYVRKRHEVMLDDAARGLMEGRWEWTVSLE